jgi:MFS family permease
MILLTAAFRILGNLIGTVWGSLASDYLPPEKRGKYFGWRNQITGFAGVMGVVFGGLLLYSFRHNHVLGFGLLFGVTSLARFLSAFLMSKMQDPPLNESPESNFSFYRFIAQFRKSNFVKFVLYVTAITFATNLSAPYFNVYMLRDLKLNYFFYMVIHLSAVVGSLVSFPVWGRHADHFGNAKILKVTSLLIPAVPALWLLPPSIPALILIEIFAGFVWGGFNLCALNFIYDAVSPEKRVRCLGYFNLINGVGIFAGATLGGLIAEKLPALMGYRLFSLFLISSILRIFSHFLLSKQFKEVRASAKQISGSKLLFSVVGIRPLLGGTRNWNLFSFIKHSAWEQ